MNRTLFDNDRYEFRKSAQPYVPRTITAMIETRSIDRSVWLEADK